MDAIRRLPNGTWVWPGKRDRYHRDDDLPAVVRADGSKEWWRNWQRHRDGGLPAVIHADGSEEFYELGYKDVASADDWVARKKAELARKAGSAT